MWRFGPATKGRTRKLELSPSERRHPLIDYMAPPPKRQRPGLTRNGRCSLIRTSPLRTQFDTLRKTRKRRANRGNIGHAFGPTQDWTTDGSLIIDRLHSHITARRRSSLNGFCTPPSIFSSELLCVAVKRLVGAITMCIDSSSTGDCSPLNAFVEPSSIVGVGFQVIQPANRR